MSQVIVKRKQELAEDELMHKQYKYVSREWKNGRWHYTYTDYQTGSDGKTIKKTYKLKNRKQADKWEESIAGAKQDVKDAKERVAKNRAEREREYERQEATKKMAEAEQKMKELTAKEEKKKKTIKNAKKSIEKGKKKLAKILKSK